MSDWIASVTTVAVGAITAFTGYKYNKLQLISNEKAFLEFCLQETSDLQFVRNIGINTAVNVKVYKVFLNINCVKKIFGKNYYKRGTVSLEQSLGTIMAGKKKKIKLVPESQSYEIFIIEYQNISGETYQTILKPQNGRGDHEFLYIPRKIRSRRQQLEGIFKSKEISLPRYIRKIYFPKK